MGVEVISIFKPKCHVKTLALHYFCQAPFLSPVILGVIFGAKLYEDRFVACA